MAVEASRGCGYRKVGGIYLVGGTYWNTCDRLKLEIPVCPCCGETLRPNRGIQPVNMRKLVGTHQEDVIRMWGSVVPPGTNPSLNSCTCDNTCPVCYPFDTHIASNSDFIIWVGRSYYDEQTFTAEAAIQGISRRIPHIPNELVIGESVIYLAMQNNMTSSYATGADGRPIKANGIFMAFKPEAIELLIWESEWSPEYEQELRLRGITPVVIPDGDEDHAGRRSGRSSVQSTGRTQTTLDIFEGL